MSLRGIDGKVAVVTGAASGMGEAVARRLSAEGAKVVLVDWNGEGASRVAGVLPGPALAVQADVSVEADVARYHEAAVERFGRVDLFHLNAGISGTFAPFPEVTLEQFEHVLAVNLRSVFLGLREALRRLAEQGGGAIVTTSSLLGLGGSEGSIPYVAAKHGVVGLTKSAALHGAHLGVRVNGIAPGGFETGLTRDLKDALGNDEEAFRRVVEHVPARRFGDPAEVGALVAFLLSEEARYLTGAVIPIDGGITARAIR